MRRGTVNAGLTTPGSTRGREMALRLKRPNMLCQRPLPRMGGGPAPRLDSLLRGYFSLSPARVIVTPHRMLYSVHIPIFNPISPPHTHAQHTFAQVNKEQ
jgi:hypothetical protein